MKIKEIFGGASPVEEAQVTESEAIEDRGDGDVGGSAGEDLRETVIRLTEALESAEAERVRRERELCVLELLSENGLPSSLSPLIMGAEGDAAAVVAELSRVISAAVERTVTQRCRSATPAGGRAVGLTSEEILKTPVAELARSMYLRK